MRYRTVKNIERAVKLIMEKGFDHDTANDVAIKIFDMVNRHSPPAEHFISLIVPKSETRRTKHD